MDYISAASEAGFYIQMVEVEALIDSLDGSYDLCNGWSREKFDNLLTVKYMDLDPMLVADMEIMGIEQPVWIEVESDGWFMADGHHRLAWAAEVGLNVPVVFVCPDTNVILLSEILCDEREYAHAA